MSKLKIGVLISGGGSNLQAIMDACDTGLIDGKVVTVGSDKLDAGGLIRARKAGIHTFCLFYEDAKQGVLKQRLSAPLDYDSEEAKRKMGSHAKFLGKLDGVDRAVIERGLLQHMLVHNVDLLVLAGFMKILTPYFIDRFNADAEVPRIMNIHPALLPAFPGVNGYEDTFNYGCWVFGSTVHFIDYGEDTGPIIGQTALQRLPTDTLETIRARGLEAEWKLYPRCIQLYAKNKLTVDSNAAGMKIVKISD